MGEIVANSIAAVCVLLRASWSQQRQETRKQHTSNIKYCHLAYMQAQNTVPPYSQEVEAKREG
jgi:hypothetical protein